MALSEPPQLGSSSGQWLSSELLTMFMYHHMRGLSHDEELQVLSKLVITKHLSFWSDIVLLQWNILYHKLLFVNHINVCIYYSYYNFYLILRCLICRTWSLSWR